MKQIFTAENSTWLEVTVMKCHKDHQVLHMSIFMNNTHWNSSHRADNFKTGRQTNIITSRTLQPKPYKPATNHTTFCRRNWQVTYAQINVNSRNESKQSRTNSSASITIDGHTRMRCALYWVLSNTVTVIQNLFKPKCWSPISAN